MKKTAIIFLVIICGIIFQVSGCSKANEEMFAARLCDTTAVQYSVDVVNILTANCYSCHGETTNAGSGGIILEGYTNLLQWADNGYLIGNITHAPGYVPMPYGGGKLSDCEISKIQAWIDQGTKNN